MSENKNKEITISNNDMNLLPYKKVKIINKKKTNSSTKLDYRNDLLVPITKIINPIKIDFTRNPRIHSKDKIEARRKSDNIPNFLNCLGPSNQGAFEIITDNARKVNSLEKFQYSQIIRKYLIDPNTNNLNYKLQKEEFPNKVKHSTVKNLPELLEHKQDKHEKNSNIFETIKSVHSNTSEELSSEIKEKVLRAFDNNKSKIKRKLKEDMKRSMLSKSPLIFNDSQVEKRFKFYQPKGNNNNFFLHKNVVPSYKRSENYYRKELSQEPVLKNIRELSMSYNLINRMNDSFDKNDNKISCVVENSKKLKELIKLTNKLVINVKKMDLSRASMINDFYKENFN
jgi:hypothetical protein